MIMDCNGWNGGWWKIFSVWYLSVKGVELQLVCALENFWINLRKGDPVVLALKNVDFFNITCWASNVIAFPGQCQLCIFCALQFSFVDQNMRIFNSPWLPHFFLCCQKPGKESTTSVRLQAPGHFGTGSSSGSDTWYGSHTFNNKLSICSVFTLRRLKLYHSRTKRNFRM